MKNDKIQLKYFVSYAHKADKLVQDFLDKFHDHASTNPKYTFKKWIDRDIIIGESWDSQIQTQIDECDFGLLLLTPSFFARDYIINKELPNFIKKDDDGNIEIVKSMVPVGLEYFNLGDDLLGLEQTQIYLHQVGLEKKFYDQLRGNKRNEFVADLLKGMSLKFDS